MNMNCPNCGNAVSPTEKFCGQCGTQMALSPATPDFTTAEQRFAELKAQYEAGTLDKKAFKSEVRELVVQDEKGEYWTIEAASGHWLWYDGESWMARPRPPAAAPSPPIPSAAAPPVQQPAAKKGLPWLAVGIGCIALLCLGAAIVGAVIAIPVITKTAGRQGTPAAVTPIVIEPTVTLAEAPATPTEAPEPTTIAPLPMDTPTRGPLELPTIEAPVEPTPTQGPLELPTIEAPVEPTPTQGPLELPTIELSPEPTATLEPTATPLPPPPPTKPATDFIVKEASLLPKSLNACETPFFELYVVDTDGKGLTNVQIAYSREGGSSDSEIKPSGWHNPDEGYVRWDAVHSAYRFKAVFDASDPSKRFTSEETPTLDTREVTDTQLLQQLGYCLPGTDCECRSFSYKVVFQRTW